MAEGAALASTGALGTTSGTGGAEAESSGGGGALAGGAAIGDAEGATLATLNPHDNSVIAEVAMAGRADIDKAVAAAKASDPATLAPVPAARGYPNGPFKLAPFRLCDPKDRGTNPILARMVESLPAGLKAALLASRAKEVARQEAREKTTTTVRMEATIFMACTA